MGFSGPGTGVPFSDGRVDVGHEVRRPGRIEIGRLAGVHAGAAADGDIAVELTFHGEGDGFLERHVGGFDARLVEQHCVDVTASQGLQGDGYRVALAEVSVRHHHDAAAALFFHVVADFTSDALAELDAGGVHGERSFKFHAVLPSLCHYMVKRTNWVYSSPERFRVSRAIADMSSSP